ncbi:MAG: hypothetical protein SOT15_06710 [Treponema sp.]|nr:hypothetical protein [Treponema sp.]
MKRSLKTFVAVLATLLPLVLTGCNQLSSLDENARQAYENKKKIQALESSFEEDATEEEKAKGYAKLAASIAGLKMDKEYKFTAAWTEIFEITSEGKVKYGDTPGNIVALLVPPDEYSGIIIIIKSDNHYNYGNNQYPYYKEENPHSGCYTGFYLKDNGSSFSEAGTTWKVPGHSYTACAKSFEDLEELFEKYGYAATCAAYSTEFPK